MGSFIRELLLDFPRLALVIQLSIIVIIIATITIIIALILLISHRYNKHRREIHEEKLIPVFDKLIYNYISFNETVINNDPEFSSKEDIVLIIKRHIRRGKDKQLFLDHLIGIKKTLTGDMGLEVNQLFYHSGLEKFTLRKLSKFANHKKIQGLSEFVALDIPLVDVYLIPLTHSRSRAVKIMARHAYIKLSKNNPFNFFDSNKEELLVWEQIELFKIITTNKKINIPNFSTWISYSKNPSVIKFCLELVAYYRQTEAVNAIIRLLDNEEHTLRAAAIRCLGRLGAVEAEAKFVSLYNEQPVQCQIEILEAISNIGTGVHVDFLTNEFRNGREFSIRKRAAKALVNNTKHDPQIVENLFSDLSEEQEIMLRHYQSPLTQSA